ncbi:MAG: hypothetical protein LIO85_05810 [Rikenellaceae bacterium]|nr:hypothetical protein [Rikenellaceae bacterium]
MNDIKHKEVNAHLHTPYSFSAFESIPQALDMAVAEGVAVVGINDFYTTAGYEEWQRECARRGLHPLFNIEMISLQADDQKAGIRVNDPNNPGRTYISGKGLANPVVLSGEPARKLAEVAEESNRQVRAMCAKLNALLEGSGITLDADDISARLTKGSLRERHLAKALRLAVEEKLGTGEQAAEFYAGLFGAAPASALTDAAALENEIRGKLLKAGGAAFVAEDPKAFLPLEEVREIILAAGGLPTYPFLADDAKGGFTDFEQELEKVAGILKQRGFHSVEFITTRNSVEVLERYAGYLWDNGFVVTFGSEHNTPAMEPILLRARGGAELTDYLKRLNYMGACIVAAHQRRVAEGRPGYLDAEGNPSVEDRDTFVKEGDRIIIETIGK